MEVNCSECEKPLEKGKPCEVTFKGMYNGEGTIDIALPYEVEYRHAECPDD